MLKKVIAVLLALTMSVTLFTGCKSDKKDLRPKEDTKTTEAEQNNDEAKGPEEEELTDEDFEKPLTDEEKEERDFINFMADYSELPKRRILPNKGDEMSEKELEYAKRVWQMYMDSEDEEAHEWAMIDKRLSEHEPEEGEVYDEKMKAYTTNGYITYSGRVNSFTVLDIPARIRKVATFGCLSYMESELGITAATHFNTMYLSPRSFLYTSIVAPGHTPDPNNIVVSDHGGYNFADYIERMTEESLAREIRQERIKSRIVQQGLDTVNNNTILMNVSFLIEEGYKPTEKELEVYTEEEWYTNKAVVDTLEQEVFQTLWLGQIKYEGGIALVLMKDLSPHHIEHLNKTIMQGSITEVDKQRFENIDDYREMAQLTWNDFMLNGIQYDAPDIEI